MAPSSSMTGHPPDVAETGGAVSWDDTPNEHRFARLVGPTVHYPQYRHFTGEWPQQSLVQPLVPKWHRLFLPQERIGRRQPVAGAYRYLHVPYPVVPGQHVLVGVRDREDVPAPPPNRQPLLRGKYAVVDGRVQLRLKSQTTREPVLTCQTTEVPPVFVRPPAVEPLQL